MTEELHNIDRLELMKIPAFRRFLFRAIQMAGICEATANGADGRNLYLEGRRSLGLEILRDVESAMPVQHPGGIPILTMLQIFREETQSQQENPNGRRARNRDTYDDLSASGGDDDT
jgi:hypothetical protein